MKLQQKQTPSFLDTFWSIDLIHRIVLQLVSVHQKSVYLYFFLPHLKYFFVSSLLSSSLLLICWKSLQFVPKKLEICCIDQFTDVMVSSFTFSLLFAIFSFSLITSFNMSRSLAFWKHSWIILLDAHPVNSSTERSRADAINSELEFSTWSNFFSHMHLYIGRNRFHWKKMLA